MTEPRPDRDVHVTIEVRVRTVDNDPVAAGSRVLLRVARALGQHLGDDAVEVRLPGAAWHRWDRYADDGEHPGHDTSLVPVGGQPAADVIKATGA